MGRDTYKRHHSIKDSTQIDLDLENQTGTNFVDLSRPEPNETRWIDPKPTASTTGVETLPHSKPDESTMAGVTSQFLSGNLTINPKNFILFIAGCYIVLACILYVQDNSLGKLDTVDGLKIFGMKLLPITGLLLLIVIVASVINFFSKRNKSKPNNKTVL